MYRIALNVAISFVRSESTRSRALVTDESALLRLSYQPGHHEGDLQLLHSLIDALDELDKALLLLYLDGHRYEEIAGVLGISETNVATKLNRIKECIQTETSGGGEMTELEDLKTKWMEHQQQFAQFNLRVVRTSQLKSPLLGPGEKLDLITHPNALLIGVATWSDPDLELLEMCSATGDLEVRCSSSMLIAVQIVQLSRMPRRKRLPKDTSSPRVQSATLVRYEQGQAAQELLISRSRFSRRSQLRWNCD